MISYRKVPRPNPHQVIKIEFHYQPTLGVHLCEHGLAMLGHHGGLVTVKGHNILMKRFFRVSQLPVQIRHTALEYTPEKSGDQCPTNSVSLGPVLQTECQCHLGFVIKELIGKSVPPEVITVFISML